MRFHKKCRRDSPGSPVVKTPCFQCRGMGVILGRRTEIPLAIQHGKKKKMYNWLDSMKNVFTVGWGKR